MDKKFKSLNPEDYETVKHLLEKFDALETDSFEEDLALQVFMWLEHPEYKTPLSPKQLAALRSRHGRY